MTDDEMFWEDSTIHNTWATRVVTCEVRNEKMCACVRAVKCSLCTSCRFHGSCYCQDAKLPERTKKQRNVKDFEYKLGSNEFDSSRDLVAPSYNLLILIEVEDRGIVGIITDPAILCLATLGKANLANYGPHMKNSTMLSFLSTLKVMMMRNTLANWNSTTRNVYEPLDPMCYLVLLAPLLECEALIYLEFVDILQEHLLMICNQIVDTMVLFVYWNQRLPCRRCCHIVVLVGEIHYAWCRSRRCSRITWPTRHSIHVPIEILGIPRHSANGPISKCICIVPILLFWLP